jgi:hypothetical protein
MLADVASSILVYGIVVQHCVAEEMVIDVSKERGKWRSGDRCGGLNERILDHCGSRGSPGEARVNAVDADGAGESVACLERIMGPGGRWRISVALLL